MFFKKYGDIVVGVFFMVLSACLIAMAQMLPKSKVMEIGPDFMPMVIGVVTFILAAILTTSRCTQRNWRERKSRNAIISA